MHFLFLGMILLACILMLLLWIGGQKPETLKKLGFNLLILGVGVLSLFLLLTGKWQFLWVSFLVILPWIRRILFIMPLLKRAWRWFSTSRPQKPLRRMSKSAHVQAEIDRNEVVVDGLLLSGTFRGWKFSELRGTDIKHVFDYLDQCDPLGTEFYAQFLNRLYGPQWQRIHKINRKSSPLDPEPNADSDKLLYLEDLTSEDLERSAFQKEQKKSFDGQAPKAKVRRTMTRAQALQLLGLTGRPDKEAINSAFYECMKNNHPDRGGSNELAARLNQARDLLLKAI